MSLPLRNSKRIAEKERIASRAAAMALSKEKIAKSAMQSRHFPIIVCQKPNHKKEGFILEIHQPKLINGRWYAGVKWNDEPQRLCWEGLEIILRYAPEAIDIWDGSEETHDTPILFKELMASLKCTFVPEIKIGAVCWITSPKEDEIDTRYVRVINFDYQKIGLQTNSHSTALYDCDFIDDSSIVEGSFADIANNRQFRINYTPFNIRLGYAMRGGLFEFERLKVLEPLSLNANASSVAATILSHKQSVKMEKLVISNVARKELLLTHLKSAMAKGQRSYRAQLQQSNVGRIKSVDISHFSEGLFIAVVKPYFRTISAVEWDKSSSLYGLDLSAESESLRAKWGNAKFRKIKSVELGSYWFGGEFTFKWTLSAGIDGGKLRMFFRVLYKDEFGIVHGRQE